MYLECFTRSAFGTKLLIIIIQLITETNTVNGRKYDQSTLFYLYNTMFSKNTTEISFYLFNNLEQ